MSPALRWFAILLLLTSKDAAAGPQWQVDRERSAITFSFMQEGASFSGNFNRFDLQLKFNPGELESSRFVADIDVGSLNTHSDDRDMLLRSAEFFDIERWPAAEFSTDAIEHMGDNLYVAVARLRIRDTSRLVDFPFSAEISGEQQLVFTGTGNLLIKRAEFGLARGDWSDSVIVGPDVKIVVNIRAVAPGIPD